ncbi:MAG: class I tRNA ligase family protein, partial [Pirellula sp.]
WFDAPIGYIASTWQWCKLNNEHLSDWWQSDRTEIHHFIGKDITYFHTLFWPGVLKASGYSLPSFVHIHGFLTVDKEKMAKSRGTMIRASKYLELLDPSYLRYYYASKLGPRPEDIDLNFQEFIAKVDSDLVGKVVNLAIRSPATTPAANKPPSWGYSMLNPVASTNRAVRLARFTTLPTKSESTLAMNSWKFKSMSSGLGP